MNTSFPEEENINITDNYYTPIKQLSEDFLKYITNYKTATSDYIKKISAYQEKYKPRLIEPKDLPKNICLNHLLSLTSIIPKIVEQQIINNKFFLEGIDSKIIEFEPMLKQKNLEYIDVQNSFKDSKNELLKKYKEIEKVKINYMTNISLAEETIHKYYMKKNIKKKNSSKLNLSILNVLDSSNELNFTSIEEQVSNSVQKAKKSEDEYKSNVNIVKDAEKNFIETAEKIKQKLRDILNQISTNLKDLISDCMVFLQNCFKMPLSEIDTYLPEVVSLDEYSKIDAIIQSSYKTDNNFEFINPEKYILKIFQQKNGFISKNSSKSLNNFNNNNTNSIMQIEEDMDYTQEEENFNTIKKMMENFDLIEKDNYDLEKEEEKLRCKYLTLKILSFAPTNKLYSRPIPPIKDEEIEEIDDQLKKKQNRVIFLQKLSQFRTRGIFEIPEREYNILSRLFNKITKMVESEEDYDSAVNIIILSQTYYIIKNNKKEYLQNQIMNNELFKTKKFWETFIRYSINKEIALNKKTEEHNGVVTEDEKENEEKYSNIVFAQLVPINDNMIEFGLDINIVEEIILPIIEEYKISPELAEVITSVINSKKLESQDLNKLMIKEITSEDLDLNNNNYI